MYNRQPGPSHPHLGMFQRPLVFTKVSQIYVLRLQMQLISHIIEADKRSQTLFCQHYSNCSSWYYMLLYSHNLGNQVRHLVQQGSSQSRGKEDFPKCAVFTPRVQIVEYLTFSQATNSGEIWRLLRTSDKNPLAKRPNYQTNLKTSFLVCSQKIFYFWSFRFKSNSNI